jgi:hypothetical protein
VPGLFFLFAAAGLLSLSTLRYRDRKRARGVLTLILIAWLLAFGVEAANAIKEPQNARAGSIELPDLMLF